MIWVGVRRCGRLWRLRGASPEKLPVGYRVCRRSGTGSEFEGAVKMASQLLNFSPSLTPCPVVILFLAAPPPLPPARRKRQLNRASMGRNLRRHGCQHPPAALPLPRVGASQRCDRPLPVPLAVGQPPATSARGSTGRARARAIVCFALFWATQLLGAFASCPNYCNGRGTCGTGNTCTCDSGYFGGDCSLSECQWCHLRKHSLPAMSGIALAVPPPCPTLP